MHCGALDACTCVLLKRILEKEARSRWMQFLMELNSNSQKLDPWDGSS